MNHDDQRNEDVQQERDVLPRRKLALVLLGVASAAIVFGGGGVLVLYVRETSLRPTHSFPESSPRREGEAPYIEQDVYDRGGRGEALNIRQRKELDGWSWVDRDKRIVRVPIDRAIDAVAGEGR